MTNDRRIAIAISTGIAIIWVAFMAIYFTANPIAEQGYQQLVVGQP